MDVSSRPRLSVIVPVLNEAGNLTTFLDGLAVQRGVDFEVVLCDGGSSDGTGGLLRSTGRRWPFPLVWTESPRGRAVQLNRGTTRARGELFLFLHADSRFRDPGALAGAVACLEAARSRSPGVPVAGHFRLRFDLPPADRDPLFAFYEAKARSGRPGTIHGDQGFLLAAEDFQRWGPFPEQPPLLEDSRFADRLLAAGRWVLLPAQIITSARRFQVEGLRPRQTLNALLMNFMAIGWEDFFTRAPDLYRQQDRAARLDLLPFFRLVGELLESLPRSERRRLWAATGAYVRGQGWQLGLLLATRWRRAGAPDAGSAWLAAWSRWWDRLTDHAPGRLAGEMAVRCWFTLMLARLERLEHAPPGRLP